MFRFSLLLSLLTALTAGSLEGATVAIGAAKDTSIFSNNPTHTAGGADVVYIGRNNSGAERRALLQFDVASAVPAGAVINSVELTLYINGWSGNAGFGADRTLDLHPVLAEWGDGTTGSGGSTGGGGNGVPAAADGDATWNQRSWSASDPTPPHETWATPGGDFGAASASLVISDTPTQVVVDSPHTWTGAGLTADVQDWLDNARPNYGWLLANTDTANASLVRFYSRELTDDAATPTVNEVLFRPMLTIDYTPVPEPAAMALTCFATVGALAFRRRSVSSQPTR